MLSSLKNAAPASLLTALLAASSASARVFPFNCLFEMLVYDRLDPIVSPNKASGHQHQISGANGFSTNMTYEDTQASSCTTCEFTEDRSNYWTPTLYYVSKNGTYIPLRTSELTLYYSMEADEDDPNFDGYYAFPKGFRMLAGTPSRRTNNGSPESKWITWSCHNHNQPIDPWRSPDGIPKKKCAGLAAEIQFPACWDGVSLDSEDHISHLRWASGGNTGKCEDPEFNKRLMAIFFITGFDTAPYTTDEMWWDGPNNIGHPFVISNGDDTGLGWHGDFVNGWKEGTLEAYTKRRCNNRDACPDLLTRAENRRQCQMNPVHDTMGYVAVDALPGNNPVGGPGSASGSASGAATTAIETNTLAPTHGTGGMANMNTTSSGSDSPESTHHAKHSMRSRPMNPADA